MGAALLGFAIRNALRAGGALRVKPAGALRCSLCGINWPCDVDHYGRCPVCLRPTDAVAGTGVEPLDPREARSIRLHHEFDRFYAARHWGAEA
jgi:hypothetical protein